MYVLRNCGHKKKSGFYCYYGWSLIEGYLLRSIRSKVLFSNAAFEVVREARSESEWSELDNYLVIKDFIWMYLSYIALLPYDLVLVQLLLADLALQGVLYKSYLWLNEPKNVWSCKRKVKLAQFQQCSPNLPWRINFCSKSDAWFRFDESNVCRRRSRALFRMQQTRSALARENMVRVELKQTSPCCINAWCGRARVKSHKQSANLLLSFNVLKHSNKTQIHREASSWIPGPHARVITSVMK